MLEIIRRVLSLLRRRYRLSQAEMARRTIWPQSVVSKVENGEVSLTGEQLDDWVTVVDIVASEVRGEAFERLTPGKLMDTAHVIAEELVGTGTSSCGGRGGCPRGRQGWCGGRYWRSWCCRSGRGSTADHFD